MSRETLRHSLDFRGDVILRVEGPCDDLQVSLGAKGRSKLLNEMTPAQTKFTAWPGVDVGIFDRVHTKLSENSIRVPLTDAQKHLPYALLHGIALLKLHQDKDYHAISDNAHQLLGGQLSHLQASGKVPRPESIEEIRAWEIVCTEERKRGEVALKLLKELWASEIDPLPYVTNVRDLTRVVNGYPLARTARGVEINAKWTGEQIEMPMTLPEYWVAALTSDARSSVPRLARVA